MGTNGDDVPAENEPQGLSAHDAQAVVNLLGRIAGMHDALADRRRALMSGVTQLLNADVWVWVHSRIGPDSQLAAVMYLDGGFTDDSERGRMVQAVHEPTPIKLMFRNLSLDEPRSSGTADWLVDATPQEQAEVARTYQMCGMSGSLMSWYPNGQGVISGIGLHRRAGKPQFSVREKFILHLIVSQIDWLHRLDELPPANNDDIFGLTRRQREVLSMLIQAYSPKQIARALGLSEHTVRDYVQAIYRHYKVNDRSELLALFIAGGKRT